MKLNGNFTALDLTPPQSSLATATGGVITSTPPHQPLNIALFSAAMLPHAPLHRQCVFLHTPTPISTTSLRLRQPPLSPSPPPLSPPSGDHSPKNPPPSAPPRAVRCDTRIDPSVRVNSGFSDAVPDVRSGDAADGLLLNCWFTFQSGRSEQQKNFSPESARVIPESTNCPTPADPRPPPTLAAPPVKRSYSDVVQHNSTTSLQFDPNHAAKKTFHEDECGTMGKISFFKGDP
ncbi:hypothetical protein Salat_2092200, partial [Sesamum alatum]